MSKSKEISTVVSEKALAELRASYPMEASFSRTLLPRLGMFSQDVVTGKGKTMKVEAEAGTFYIDRQTNEEDENGRKVWEKKEIGTETEGIILYQRRQLRHYDADTEAYTSSPIYDTDEDVIPLFRDKQEVAKGTPGELKARKEFQGLSAKGKPISKLEENRILYVLMDDEVFQLNLRGTSMYAFMTYTRKTLPPSVVTVFNSEAKEKGTIAWNQMTFTAARTLTGDEVKDVQSRINEIKEGVAAEKAYYGKTAEKKEKDELEAQFD